MGTNSEPSSSCGLSRAFSRSTKACRFMPCRRRRERRGERGEGLSEFPLCVGIHAAHAATDRKTNASEPFEPIFNTEGGGAYFCDGRIVAVEADLAVL